MSAVVAMDAPREKLSNGRFLPDVGVAIILLLIAAIPLMRVMAVPGQLVYHGDIDIIALSEVPIREAYAHLEWPLWNPYASAGTSAIGDAQAHALYPPSILLGLLPFSTGYNLGALIHIWLAGLGLYAYLASNQVRRSAALLAGIAFMLSGAVVPRILAGHLSFVYAAAWPGWILWTYKKLLQTPSLRYFLLSVCFTCLSLAVNYPPLVIITLLPVAGYVLYEGLRQLRIPGFPQGASQILTVVASAACAIGLTAPQWLSTVEWFGQTARSTGLTLAEATGTAFSWPHLPTLVAPLIWYSVPSQTPLGFGHFWEVSPFVGVIPLTLSLLAWIVSRNNRRSLIAYFSIIALLGIVLAWQGSPIYWLVYQVIPYFREAGRYLFLWTFAISVLAGLGLDEILERLENEETGLARSVNIQRAATLASTTAAGVTSLALLGWVLFGSRVFRLLQTHGLFTYVDSQTFVRGQQHNLVVLVITTFMMLGLTLSITHGWLSPKRWGWFVVGAATIEMLIFATSLITPFAETNLYDPSNPLAQLNLSASEVRLQGGRTSPNYGVPTVFYRWDGGNLRSLEAIQKLGLDGGRGSQLLSAGYYVANEADPDHASHLVKQAGEWVLYEYDDNWPRIYGAPHVRAVASDEEALTAVAEPGFNPWQAVIITSEDPVQELDTARKTPLQFDAEFTRYENNRFTATVETNQPVMAVFSETYYPGWHAWVDGREVPVWKANYAFRGVIVPAGRHEVRMEYHPRSFQIGLTISIVTLGITLVLASWLAFRKLRISETGIHELQEHHGKS